MRLKVFGQHPRGTSMTRIQSSPNYREGKFHNLTHSPLMKDGFSVRAMWGFFYG
ncbi:hypothetical protein MKQ70_04685 [Chitinophaga sedimenti]|uniref:hypothetical protein n=1 Tax=Chitinophaga sedimenti TaxID=2033606 RepID=UPI002004CAE6|nr:hypothetical protein [Chitinophaga sedimenti]MCK7554340.1 hypothetical protein [Chitinophaga sedimenti]